MTILRVLFAVLIIVALAIIPVMIIRDKRKRKKEEPTPTPTPTPTPDPTPDPDPAIGPGEGSGDPPVVTETVTIKKIKVINQLSMCEEHTDRLGALSIVWDYEAFSAMWNYPNMEVGEQDYDLENAITIKTGENLTIDEFTVDAFKSPDELGPVKAGTVVDFGVGESIVTHYLNTGSELHHISIPITTNDDTLVIRVGALN